MLGNLLKNILTIGLGGGETNNQFDKILEIESKEAEQERKDKQTQAIITGGIVLIVIIAGIWLLTKKK